MASLHFKHEINDTGVALQLYRRTVFGGDQLVPVVQWSDCAESLHFGSIAYILSLLSGDTSGIHSDSAVVVLDNFLAAAISEPIALGLGLPPAVPFVLQLRAEGAITDRDFELRARWINHAGQPQNSTRTGAFASVAGQKYRIPEPIYSMLTAVQACQAAASDERLRFETLGKLQELFPQDARERLAIDEYLFDIRVLHATAFSLNLRTADGAFDFDPVLFGREVAARAFSGQADELLQDGNVSEAESLLTPHQAETFAANRFRAYDDARDRYVIERGTYVFLDPALKDALSVVRCVQRGEPKERKTFVRSPASILKSELGSRYDSTQVARLFIETEQFSARVVDVGVWSPPVLPWITPQPNDWLPEKFGLRIGDQYVQVEPSELPELRDAVQRAYELDEDSVKFKGISVPATAATLDALQTVSGVVSPDGKSVPRVPKQHEADSKHILVVTDNFQAVAFSANAKRRTANSIELPASVRSTPLPHQRAGLAWLQRAWTAGLPGVLLADDMGLGKTFQVLSFLGWAAEQLGASKQNHPFLIVAPTGLLKNWEDEHSGHLWPPGLGRLCKVYGTHLSHLRRSGSRDIKTGAPALDDELLRRSDWVLTTYETLRDYQFSFAKIPFSCAVFDEIQKAKNPASLIWHATSTVNSDFTVGLTGTPMENRLEDIWAIMDILTPGYLGDLKSFPTRYNGSDSESLEQLRARLLDPENDRPPAVLRRLKVDHLQGLPEKRVHLRRRNMPPAQAIAYAEIVNNAKRPDAPPILETLHRLRGVSLHPLWPDVTAAADPDSYIAQSARLLETFAVLDTIAERGEKTLIFLESLDMQDELALIIKRRYRLPEIPLQINGQISGDKRKERVDRFQSSERGFGVMILSPKAGGVGLTLTAANHVVHLSRWWNPAVEDQCTDRTYRIGQSRPVNIYVPLAIHPEYHDGSFDVVLNALLDRKRELGRRMLIPPVNTKEDEEWFAAHLNTKPGRDFRKVELEEIDAMEPVKFERWAISQMAARGYVADKTPFSGDGGADGVMVHKSTKSRVIIQCKLRQTPTAICDDSAIDDLLRARTAYGYANATLVALTNASRFSDRARKRASEYGIFLVARDELKNWPAGFV